MYCEKCGQKLTGFEKFCPSCGSIIEYEEYSSNDSSTDSSTNTQSNPYMQKPVSNQQNSGSGLTKKSISKKSKILIAISSLSVIAIIVAAIIIVPIITSINLKDYIEIDLSTDDEEILYNGHIDADLSIDEDKSVDVGDVIKYCDIDLRLKDGDDNESEEYSDDVNNIKKDDVLVVSITWPKDIDDLNEIEEIEDTLGVHFWKRDTVYEIKVKDIISDEGYKVAEPIDLNVFESLKSLFVTKGYSDEKIEFSMQSSSETPIGDYTFKLNADDERLDFKDKSGNIIDYVSLEGFKYNLSNGDVVTIELSKEHISGTDIFLTPKSKDFTIKGNTPLSVKDAKNNVKLIKKAVVELDTEKNSDYGVYGTSLVKAYLFNVKEQEKDEEEFDEKLVVITKDKVDQYGTKYIVKVFNDPTIINGKLECTESRYLDTWEYYCYRDTLQEAEEFLQDMGKIGNYNRTTIF